MRTIAKKAGVSATTVSLALRDDPSISLSTKTRIREIQAELGYRPLTRRTRLNGNHVETVDQIIYRVIGVDLHEDTYVPFLNGISQECSERSIKLEFESGQKNRLQADPHPQQKGVTSARVGVILTGTLDGKHVADARADGRPFVVLGNYTLADPVHAVGVDLMDAATSMMRTLHEEGMQKLAIVVEDTNAAWESNFLCYLRGAYLDLGYSSDFEMLVETGNGFARAGEAAEKILGQARPGLKILTLEAHCAQHLLIELQARRTAKSVEIPLVSFGDRAKTSTQNRHYRIFDIGKAECAKLAVIKLVQLCTDPGIPPHTSLISPPGWV